MEKNYSIMVQHLKRKKAVSILALAFMASISVNGQTWTGAVDTDFLNAANWSTGATPVTGVAITIPAVTNNPIVVSGTTSVSGAISITLGGNLKVQGSLSPSAISYTGGTIVVDGGTLNVRSNLYLGVKDNPATVTVNSGTLNARTSLIVGENGDCVLDINGGTVSVDQNSNGSTIIVGGYTKNGIINLNGGSLITNPLKVGTAALAIQDQPTRTGTGKLIINGGTLVLRGDQKAFIDGYVEGGKIVAGAGKKIVVTVIPAIPAIIADPTATPPVIGVAAVAAYTNVTAQAILGMDSKTLNNSFSVYPNPSKGVININAKNTSGNLNVSIYNLLGQQVLSSSLEGNNSGNYSLDASTKLTSGTYIVNIKSDSSNYSSKIVVE